MAVLPEKVGAVADLNSAEHTKADYKVVDQGAKVTENSENARIGTAYTPEVITPGE